MKPQFFLPVMTYPDQTSTHVISNAIDLARHRGASLHVAAIETCPAPVSAAWALILLDTETLVSKARQASRHHAAQLVDFVRQRCAEAGVTATCETIEAGERDACDLAARMARSFDLSLLQSASRFQPLTEAVVFDSGRPAILYPDSDFVGRIDHLAIAWDGSRTAARALGDASPFLATASRVSIIRVTEDDRGDGIAEHLRARGLEVGDCPVAAGDRAVGDALQQKAVEIGADLLVMGGFGHSRMREFILGGVTQDVLDDPRLPILMSH